MRLTCMTILFLKRGSLPHIYVPALITFKYHSRCSGL